MCGVCGGPIYYCGKHLRCRNSLPQTGGACWNHVQVPAEKTRGRICSWLAEFLGTQPRLRQAMVEILWKELDQPRRRAARNQPDPAREIAALQRQAANLTSAIAEGGQLKALVERLAAIESALEKARAAQANVTEVTQGEESSLSRQAIEESLATVLGQLAGNSFEFAGVLRKIFPEFTVQPVEALDSGQVRPRARLLFQPAAILDVAGQRSAGGVSNMDALPVVLDLFDPPEHIAHLRRCLDARATHPDMSLKGIAVLLGLGRMTVKRAFDYAHLMQQAGAGEPYRQVQESPSRASRWHRSKRASSGPVITADGCLSGANS